MSDEKKITRNELEELLEDNQGNDTNSWFSLPNLFALLVLNWQWFLLSLIICISASLIYVRYATPIYKVSGRMLVKDENRNRRNATQMLANMQDMGFLTNSTGIDNEIEVIQSRVLLRDVVKDLKLYAEYKSEGKVKNNLIYAKQPITVDIDPVHLDSLDKMMLEETRQFQLRLHKEGKSYIAEGKLLRNGQEVSGFTYKFSSLPANYKTQYGTLTFTKNPNGDLMKEGAVWFVTIRPAMQVATQYLGRLSVAPTSKLTSIAELTLNDENVRRGLDFINQLAICYNRQANADKNEIALRTEEFINDRMSKINEELGLSDSKIESIKRSSGVTTLSDASQSVQMSNQFSSQLSQANSQIQMLDYLREFVNNPKNQYQIIPSNVGLTDGASVSLINSYNKAVQDRNRLLKSATEEAPQVQTLTSTIDELQSSIQTALMQARRSADINRQGIQSQYAMFRGQVSSAPVTERVLSQVGRQQDVKSGLYLMLLEKREENSIALAATADKGKLIDEPLSEGKVSPKTPIIFAAAVVLAFVFPACVLFLISLFRYKVEGHDDLARLTDLPIIADVAIASDKVKQKAGIVVQANKNNQIDEIFRSMRTNIQFMLKEGENVILFTSSTSGEGKTFNAANLAVSFALLGKKVILCGLDIRKPALGRLFDISDREAGITALLTTGKITDADIVRQIQKSGINDNLDLLLAGPVPPNPSELLARDNFDVTLNYLKTHYDYVILDTAPVGLVTDTIQIGRSADLTVYVTRADYTPKSMINLLNTLNREEKMPNPCIVLNGVDMSKRKYGYYYGYGRYGKYGRYGYGRYGRYGSYGHYGSYGQYGQYAESHYSNKDDESIKQ